METQADDFKEMRVGEAADTTILDVLNEDCWRLILDHVPVNDIVRSERVSRAWQRIVLDYLAGVHNYRIEYAYALLCKLPKKYWNYRSINLQDHCVLFEEMIQKMGPFMVQMVANCIDDNRLKAVALHCTNLEALTFYRTFQNLPLHYVTKCKQLKRIMFESCGFREDYLSEMITSETLEELSINRNSYVTGRFLTHLRKSLKALALNRCQLLLFKYIKSAENYLTKLTRLELNKNRSDILQNVHLLLDRMPELEHLSLMQYYTYTEAPCVGLPMAIGRLRRLKELHVWGNVNVTDEWLSAVATGCSALRSVNVGRTSVTGRGVVALCRARPALVELGVSRLDVTDEDLEACARCCGGLMLLDATSCPQMTRTLLERLARPRARPLLLRLKSYPKEIDEVDDDSLNEVLTVESLEELTIFINSQKLGGFLTNIKQNMKSLNLCYCKTTVPDHINSGGNWPGITQLQLRSVAYSNTIADKDESLQRVPVLLDKTPNLEHLAFTHYRRHRCELLAEEWLKSICRLGRLQELHLFRNDLVTDEWLAVAARALPALRAVDVGECRAVSAAGVLALCRAQPALRRLGVASVELSEADVEACVRLCEGLEYLDASWNHKLTVGMLERIARPRPQPLVMRLFETRLCGNQVDDDSLNEVLTVESLEELTIFINSQKLGGFLTNIKQNMKSLNLCYCKTTVPDHINSGGNWPGITQLQLRSVAYSNTIADKDESLQRVPVLLDKTPNLEHLAFTHYRRHRCELLAEEWLKSICRLGRLQELHLFRNDLVTDEWLAVAARALPALRAVDVGECRAVSAAGVLALCRAQPALRRLGVASVELSEADVEACVRLCEGLEYLDASWNHKLTVGMLERIARPRPQPLVMRLFETRLCGNQVLFEGLEVIWNWMEKGWTRDYCTTSLNLDFDRSLVVRTRQ